MPSTNRYGYHSGRVDLSEVQKEQQVIVELLRQTQPRLHDHIQSIDNGGPDCPEYDFR